MIYPFKLFVTFIHEGSHALAAVLTNSSIYSLGVSPDTSGLVLAAPESTLAALIISSAGYVGATVFGALLLVLIRRAWSARVVLAGMGVYVALLTTFFGLLLSIWNFSHVVEATASKTASEAAFGVTFTVASGFILSAALLLIARFGSAKVAQFFLSFLAVQCVLNALFDLKTVLSYSFSPVHTDAVNMYNATGIPSPVWIMTWIAISLVVVSIALRFYAVGKKRRTAQQDLPFED